MNYKGYALLKRLDNCFIGLDPVLDEQAYKEVENTACGTILPIMDVAVENSGLLLIGPKGSCLIDCRNLEDVQWFECDFVGTVMIPKGLSELEKMAASAKRLARKGGYSKIVRQMVALDSIRKGRFDDDFIFELQ